MTKKNSLVRIDKKSTGSTKSLKSSTSKKSTRSAKLKRKRHISQMSVTSDFGKMKNYEDVIAGPSAERKKRSSSRKKSNIPRSQSPSAVNKKIRVDKRTLSEYRHTCDYLEGQIQSLKKQHKDFLELKA